MRGELPPLPPLAVDLRCFADEQPWPMARRFVCIDFETTRIWKKDEEQDPAFWAKPCYNYPMQISVDIVEPDLSVTHAFDALIVGAIQTVRFTAEKILPELGLNRFRLKSDLQRSGRLLADVLGALADLLGPNDVLVSHNLTYDVGRVLGVNFWNEKAEPHFDEAKDSLERILAAPRLCTMLWKTKGPYAGLERLTQEYGVTNEHAHDARGDSKALAECLAKAIRQQEHLPVCNTPICFDMFKREAAAKWAAPANWIDIPPPPNLTLRVSGEMDIRVSLKRSAVDVTASSEDRNVKQKTEESEISDTATP